MQLSTINFKIKTGIWFKIIFLLLVFLFGSFFAAYLYKNGKIIPLKLNAEYVNETGFKFLKNKFNASSERLEKIYLDVKFKEWKKLSDQRNEVWNYATVLKYFHFQWTDSIPKIEIKGKIKYLDSKKKKVKLRLTGMNYDHYAEPKKWSYRVSVKGDNSIDGQKKFNLLAPNSRGFLNDFVGQSYLKELGMIYLRIKPVELILNGDNLGIYLKEEFFDKRLIEFNRFRESAIIKFNGLDIDISEKKYIKYNIILDKFKLKLNKYKNNNLALDELFNFDMMADRMALSLLFGDYHSLIDFNQRYYINPFLAKLEPLGREWHYTRYNNDQDLIGNINKIKTLYNQLLNNENFISKLNKSIKKITSKDFINKFYKKNIQEITELKNILYSEYVFFDSPRKIIENNSKILRAKEIWFEKSINKKEITVPDIFKELGEFKNDTLTISRNLKINKNIHIPSGYTVVIKPGVQIIFEEGGQIISESSFIAIGKKENYISFSSNGENKIGGILFINAKKSTFKFVQFKGLTNYSDEYRVLPGSVCFYESPVTFSNTIFDKNYGGDDLLNIVRSKFSIIDSELNNSNADALDSDFSSGEIINTIFNNVGNDAIDVSGTELNISKIKIISTKDKGISVGEDSHIVGKDIYVSESSLAFTSKDFSTLEIDSVFVDKCDVIFTVFQKKTEYGPASIICKNGTFKNYKEEYLVQLNNNLTVNNKPKKIKVKDVESKLYGALYGKSSK